MTFYGKIIDITDDELQLKYYRAQMKKQERIVVHACLAKHRIAIDNLRAEFNNKLTTAIQELYQYHSETMVQRLDGCFEGATADMAKNHLHNIPKRILQNSIK